MQRTARAAGKIPEEGAASRRSPAEVVGNRQLYLGTAGETAGAWLAEEGTAAAACEGHRGEGEERLLGAMDGQGNLAAAMPHPGTR